MFGMARVVLPRHNVCVALQMDDMRLPNSQNYFLAAIRCALNLDTFLGASTLFAVVGAWSGAG